MDTLITPLMIYWIMIADSAVVLFRWMAALSIIGSVAIALLILSINGDRTADVRWGSGKKENLKLISYRNVIWPLPFAFIFLVLATLFPSTKILVTMYGIPAAIEAAKTVNTELNLSGTAKTAIESANKLMQEYLNGK